MEWALAGMVFGFLGSFHCVGMCGPLALALPGSDRNVVYLITSRLVYNLGRVITCTLLGLAVGLISEMISIGGFQRSFSIIVGFIIISGVFFSAFREKLNQWKAYPSTLIGKTTKPIAALFKNGSIGALFLIGLLNALLPCGFIYLGLSTALTSGAVLKSVYFMAGFGMGTVPAMLGMSLASGFVSLSMRKRMRQFSPYFIALVGMLLILRGLNLAIPFLSPHI